jgi:ABC-type branched-subunit amino acid transport system ATPase component
MKQTGAIVLLVEQNVHGALAVADWVSLFIFHDPEGEEG